MRRFEHALRLDETPIGEIKINVKSRDDIPALLLGLQHLYVSCREELEALLGCHVTGNRDPENGRPGMTLWRVLVMAVLKQGLDCDYDRLGELVDHHQVIRKMLQHGFLDDWTYSVRTLQDNVSLVTPALLQELNALLVREGHAVAGKPPGTALDGRVDSFVVETDVHYPTDVNLLWDAMRVVLTEVSVCCGSHEVSGWRQGQYWRSQVRQGYQRVSRARLWCRRPKAVAAWLTLCGDLTGRLGDTLEEAGRIAGGLGVAGAAVAMALVSRLLGAFAGSDPPSRAGRGNDPARGETVLAVRAAYALDHEGQGRPAGRAGGSPDGAGRSTSVHPGLALAVAWRRCGRGRSAGGSMPGTVSGVARMQFRPGVPQPRQPTATGRGAGARRVAREGARHGGQPSSGEGKASFVARRRRHPGVESAIHALESHGLDRVRTHGRAGFERTVGISILAANLHRLGRLLQQRAAWRSHRTHAPPYRLAA